MSERNFPYGYKMSDGAIAVDEGEAKYVRLIFEMKYKGMGVCEIGRCLYKENIPFFSDTVSKTIKKASAILYKQIYAGNEKYPAIIDRGIFDEIQKMKPPAFRKKKEKKPEPVFCEEYEIINDEETERIRNEIIRMIMEHAKSSEEISGMISEYAERKYQCIKRKEDKNGSGT